MAGAALRADRHASAVEAAICYARHMLNFCRFIPTVAPTYVCPLTGHVTHLRLSTQSSTGYWGVRRLDSSRRLARPFLARLGPTSADIIGHFDSAVAAALAVRRALDAREALIAEIQATSGVSSPLNFDDSLETLPSVAPSGLLDYLDGLHAVEEGLL